PSCNSRAPGPHGRNSRQTGKATMRSPVRRWFFSTSRLLSYSRKSPGDAWVNGKCPRQNVVDVSGRIVKKTVPHVNQDLVEARQGSGQVGKKKKLGEILPLTGKTMLGGVR